MTSFLHAMGVAREKVVPEHVGRCAVNYDRKDGDACSTSICASLSLNGAPLDKYIISVATRPTADRQVWRELIQVGRCKTETDHAYINSTLQRIARAHLVPELQRAKHDVLALHGKQHDSSHVRRLLFLYRLTDSMLHHSGQRMVRVGSISSQKEES